ncbi:MAG: alanine racemase [Gemmatimonadetes bacterium]|nr:alanine racemase [Gemmatimonadota bacterium]
MRISRRNFVAGAAAIGLARPSVGAAAHTAVQATIHSDRFDPWIEVDPSALRHNVGEIARLGGGRPILAVVKNNAYGLGFDAVGSVLDPMEEIAGFAVVKASAAITLRQVGVRKPILLMAMFAESDGPDLVTHEIQLSLCTDDAADRIRRLAASVGHPIAAHLYLDTGMSRMGMPYHRALPWMTTLASRDDLRIAGTFMAFTEETAFDHEQLDRFTAVTGEARRAGANLGQLHAASSNGVFHLPEARLDLVRPGIAIYGGYPSRPEEERAMATLRPAFRLRARVSRVQQLRPGDSVSYGRRYVADRPTWIATLPIGHSDGYPGQAVNRGRILIGDNLYPVIGSVSASHTIVEVGDERSVQVGDVATLVGPDHPDITPNTFADAVGVSVYDVMMHMNPGLPRVLL